MDLDVNVDPQRRLAFHGAMLSHAQDDERVRRAWEESDGAHCRRHEEELREAWIVFYRRMASLHESLAEENRQKALALEGPADPQESVQEASA